MTTKVTVDAHAGWPVEVELLYENEDPPRGEIRHVFPDQIVDFYIHDGCKITSIEELSKDFFDQSK